MNQRKVTQYVTITIKLPVDTRQIIDKYAAKANCSRNTFINVLISRALSVLALGD